MTDPKIHRITLGKVRAEMPTFRNEKPAYQDLPGAEYSKIEAFPIASKGHAVFDPLRPAASPHAKKIIVIEPRILVRECLMRAFHAANEMNLAALGNVDDALEEFSKGGEALFLLSVSGPLKIATHGQTITRLIAGTGAPVTVLGDGENLDEIVQMFDLGAAGYISTDFSFEVVVESLRLMLAGGKFVPPSILLSARPSGPKKPPLEQYRAILTERQIAVLGALSIGKANKAIANELKMTESAVKVQVRKLLKMLNARNRTELALIVKEQTKSPSIRTL